MAKEKETMCPIFEDMVCPQGKDATDSCKVRLEADFDPMSDYKDYAFMNCAIRLAREQENQQKI